MKNFLFLDVFTQKLLVENFGSIAIDGASDIRENLMNLSGLVVGKSLNFVAYKSNDKTYSSQDLECLMDTEIEDAKLDYTLSDKQIIIQKDSLDIQDYISETKDFVERFNIETVFIYGVPFDKVTELCLQLKQLVDKVWLVVDATKNAEGNERELAKDLQKEDIKLISTRNLEKYLDM